MWKYVKYAVGVQLKAVLNPALAITRPTRRISFDSRRVTLFERIQVHSAYFSEEELTIQIPNLVLVKIFLLGRCRES